MFFFFKQDKSLSFLLTFWDKEREFFIAYILGWREYTIKLFFFLQLNPYICWNL